MLAAKIDFLYFIIISMDIIVFHMVFGTLDEEKDALHNFNTM